MMRSGPVHHAIQQAIDDIWKIGHTPRIQVDARRADVIVPEFVKTKWGARLVLDLDASWPLNLSYHEAGIELDLAFQGLVSRCTLPWEAIYVVLDRATGAGVVIEAHMPRDPATEPDVASGEMGSELRAAADESAELEPITLEHAPRPPPKLAPTKSAASTDEEAKRRRSRFKVIDGGG
jgi:stringent starvation protein B